VTLAQLRAAYPHLFHPNQDWFGGEAFMHVEPHVIATPLDPATAWELPRSHAKVSAATLAALYVANPNDPLWQFYLWTSDTDQHGQQVYVGVNERGFEVHRHLHITPRWRTPRWT
jgi:hypothetical protein